MRKNAGRAKKRRRLRPAVLAVSLLALGAAGALTVRYMQQQTAPPASPPAEQPYVPRLPTSADLRAGYHGPGTAPGTPQVRHFAIVELNSASLEEIETLPGITPEYAAKIVAGRPYRSMKEIEDAGVPHDIVDQISPPAVLRVEQSGPIVTQSSPPMRGGTKP